MLAIEIRKRNPTEVISLRRVEGAIQLVNSVLSGFVVQRSSSSTTKYRGVPIQPIQ